MFDAGYSNHFRTSFCPYDMSYEQITYYAYHNLTRYNHD